MIKSLLSLSLVRTRVLSASDIVFVSEVVPAADSSPNVSFGVASLGREYEEGGFTYGSYDTELQWRGGGGPAELQPSANHTQTLAQGLMGSRAGCARRHITAQTHISVPLLIAPCHTLCHSLTVLTCPYFRFSSVILWTGRERKQS